MDGKILYRKYDFTLRQVAPDERVVFDAFIAQSPRGNLLQSYGWGEHKREAGWTPLRFLIEHRGLTRAAATVLRRRIPGTPWCFFYVPRGPALDFADRAAAVFFRDALRFLARRHRAVFAKLDLDVPDQAIEVKRLLDRYGFIPARGLPSGTHRGLRLRLQARGLPAVAGRLRVAQAGSPCGAIGPVVLAVGQGPGHKDHAGAGRRGGGGE